MSSVHRPPLTRGGGLLVAGGSAWTLPPPARLAAPSGPSTPRRGALVVLRFGPWDSNESTLLSTLTRWSYCRDSPAHQRDRCAAAARRMQRRRGHEHREALRRHRRQHRLLGRAGRRGGAGERLSFFGAAPEP